MKKKLYRSMCLLAVGAILLTMMISLFAFHSMLQTQVQENLRNECYMIAAGLNGSTDQDAYLAVLEQPLPKTNRVTVVRPDGTVRYDSIADTSEMANHGTREEIKAAFAEGEGTAERVSYTFGENTYYCAVLLEDGNVVRVATSSLSFFSVLLSILPLFLIIIFLVVTVCVFLSKQVTEQIVSPVTLAADRLAQHKNPDAPYEELVPFFEKIRAQRREIHEHIDTIRADQKRLRWILENMSEGLILLAADLRILMHNHAAEVLLDVEDSDYTGLAHTTLIRKEVLLNAVHEALSGTSSAITLDEKERAVRCYINPVTDHGQINGVLLFLLDATAQYRAEQMRSEFSANVSHELRTPLTSISGFAELLENGMVETAHVQEVGATIHRESQRLLSLIGDIIRLSRLEEQQGHPMDRVNLLTLAKGVCASLKEEAERHAVTIRCTGTDQIVEGDFGMLRELIRNLCENAVRYNRENGFVTVIVDAKGDKITLTVIDTGIGIPAEEQPRVFERFYRVDKSRSKETGGTGLGLSIVKHIVEYHGGSIELDSIAGEGTRITVAL